MNSKIGHARLSPRWSGSLQSDRVGDNEERATVHVDVRMHLPSIRGLSLRSDPRQSDASLEAPFEAEWFV
jgi:hypothetical protein